MYASRENRRCDTIMVQRQAGPSPVGCGVPSHPENGFVQSLNTSQGTQQGSEIFFGCNTSYIPAGNMIATCALDRMWNPDPATFMCICKFIHCS